MKNIKAYLRSDNASFPEMPFNAVDALILSWFSYMDLPGEAFINGRTTIREIFLSEYFDRLSAGILFPEDSLELLALAAASRRFRNICISDYVSLFDNDAEKQFSATAFHLSDNVVFAAFRGTDTSITGWKEDFNLSLEAPVPSQKEAVNYLIRLHAAYPHAGIMTGGHSKGGNLAVYAAASVNAEIRRSVSRVYSFDGPGFPDSFLKLDSFSEISPRIRKYIPQSALIGSLFEQECECSIVHSTESGIMQHNPFSWETGSRDFVFDKKLKHDAVAFCLSVNQWIARLSVEDRKRFIDTVFEILKATGTSDFNDFGSHLRDNIFIIAKSTAGLDKDTRDFLVRTLCELAAINIQNVPIALGLGKNTEKAGGKKDARSKFRQ